MVKLNKIYTRTGDDGTSGLIDGTRRAKHDVRFVAIGDVDELNSFIGVARLHVAPEVDVVLGRVQNDLFDLGADLSMPDNAGSASDLRIIESQVARLEREIDLFNDPIAPLKSFILPSGSPAASHLHVARAVARRAERAVLALAVHEKVSEPGLRYLNRLSDLLFVLARAANKNGTADVLWEKGKTR